MQVERRPKGLPEERFRPRGYIKVWLCNWGFAQCLWVWPTEFLVPNLPVSVIVNAAQKDATSKREGLWYLLTPDVSRSRCLISLLRSFCLKLETRASFDCPTSTTSMDDGTPFDSTSESHTSCFDSRKVVVRSLTATNVDLRRLRLRQANTTPKTIDQSFSLGINVQFSDNDKWFVRTECTGVRRLKIDEFFRREQKKISVQCYPQQIASFSGVRNRARSLYIRKMCNDNLMIVFRPHHQRQSIRDSTTVWPPSKQRKCLRDDGFNDIFNRVPVEYLCEQLKMKFDVHRQKKENELAFSD